MEQQQHHQVLVIGGGTAGITVAAILRRRAPDVGVTLVEPSEQHYYQPAFTLVGAGVYPLAKTRRPEASLIPAGVRWVRGAAASFEPDANTVVLQDGQRLRYEHLVVCTGVKLDWNKIEGLADTLGRNGDNFYCFGPSAG